MMKPAQQLIINMTKGLVEFQ